MSTVLQVDENGMPPQPTSESDENFDAMATNERLTMESSSVQSHQEYDPYSFSKEVERLDDMQKTLNDVKQKLYQANMQSLLLNADVVTMFDPVSAEELKKVVMDCTRCAERIEQMQRSDIEELQQQLGADDGQEVKGQSEKEPEQPLCNEDNRELEMES